MYDCVHTHVCALAGHGQWVGENKTNCSFVVEIQNVSYPLSKMGTI